jgi:uncharacterized membrane protein
VSWHYLGALLLGFRIYDRRKNEYIGSPDNPRTVAVVAYITFIGWLIARFGMLPSNRSTLSYYHLKQALLIHILSLLKIAYSFIPRSLALLIVIGALSAILFVIWLLSFINALNGLQRPAPLIGRLAEALF